RLPPGLVFAAASPSQGFYDPATGLWAVGTVPAGAAPGLVVTALVAGPAPQANVAAVAHADQFDPDPGNNTGVAVVAPPAPPPPPSFPDLLPSVVGKVFLLGSGLTDGEPDLVPNALFVNGLYHDVLGRAADQAGLDGWVVLLEAGVNR